MEKVIITCDLCKKEIYYNNFTHIDFNIFDLPKVDLCKKCAKSIYKLIKRGIKT